MPNSWLNPRANLPGIHKVQAVEITNRELVGIGMGVLLLLLGVMACRPSPRPEHTAVLPTIAPTTPILSLPQPPTPPITPVATRSMVATATAYPPPDPTTTPCTTPGRVERYTIHSATAGGSMAYQLYFPPCYGQNGRLYPTLYLLPGNIHDEQIWADLGIGQAADAAIQSEAIPPLLIVMPAGGWLANNTSGGPGSYESFILNELIPHIEQTSCAWPEAAGRAIGGLSRGGYWALSIAFRHPQQFMSVGGHSAALLDTHAGPDVNPQQTGLTNQLHNLRIYLDIGRDDYLINNIRRLHEDMETAVIPHTWVLNDGLHEENYWATHLTDYLHWYTVPWPLTANTYPPCATR